MHITSRAHITSLGVSCSRPLSFSRWIVRPLRRPAVRAVAFAFTATLWTSTPTLAQSGVEKAVEVVDAFVRAHGLRFEDGRQPLLNQASASRPFLVDNLAVDGLQGALGFDPIYDAQDARITNLQVRPDPDAPILQGAAQVTVRFDNFGAPQTLLYTLVRVTPDGQWQINDIHSPANGWSLTDLARQKGLLRQTDPDQEVTMARSSTGLPPEPPLDGLVEKPAMEPSETDLVPAGTSGSIAGAETPQQGLSGNDQAAAVGADGDLLFILDASGSMWGQIDGVAKITTAKQALSGLIADLPATTNYGLMAYGHRREGDCTDTQVLLPVGRYALGQMKATVDTVTPRGKTPIAGALQAAKDAFSGADRQADVLLISDGLETCGGDPCAAAGALAAFGIRTRVHVVGFDLSADEKAALQCVAEEGGGQYFTADNADQLVDAIKQVAKAAAQEPTPPASPPTVEPVVPAQAELLFEETFDGPAISESWTVQNSTPDLMELDGEGALFAAVTGRTTSSTSEEALNRYVLDTAFPEGDFDLVLDFRFVWQTGWEEAWVSVLEDADNQVVAGFQLTTGGCGTGPNLVLSKTSRVGSEKPDVTEFTINLYDGIRNGSVCIKPGRAYADEIMKSMSGKGVTLRLKRLGRTLAAEAAFEVPATDDIPAALRTVETEAVTVLRLSGKPSFLVGQAPSAKLRESIFFVDRFAIERPVR